MTHDFCFELSSLICRHQLYPQYSAYCAPTHTVDVAVLLDCQSKLCNWVLCIPPEEIGANLVLLLHCYIRLLISSVPSSQPAVDILLPWQISRSTKYFAPLLHRHTRFLISPVLSLQQAGNVLFPWHICWSPQYLAKYFAPLLHRHTLVSPVIYSSQNGRWPLRYVMVRGFMEW